MKRELPGYLAAAAQAPALDKADVNSYTKASSSGGVPMGQVSSLGLGSPHIAFSPNLPCVSECFPAENMYGDDQMSSLADQPVIRPMLAYTSGVWVESMCAGACALRLS